MIQIENLSSNDITILKNSKPAEGPVLTLHMTRVFRMSNTIHNFIQEPERRCSSEHREYGYLIPPDHARQGHEIKGVLPIWYEVPEHQHMKCNKSPCSDCLLLHIEGQFDELISKLRNIYKVP